MSVADFDAPSGIWSAMPRLATMHTAFACRVLSTICESCSVSRRDMGALRFFFYQNQCLRGPLGASIAEVVELQRDLDLRTAQQLNRGLQLISLFADDPHLVALDARLHLQFRVLDEARYLPARFRIDAVLEHHLLAGAGEVRQRLLRVQAGLVEAALGLAQLEDL